MSPTKPLVDLDQGITNPIALFRNWMNEAEASEPNDANAMAVATADARGRPAVRILLLKDVDDYGFVFYSNLESRKGLELRENPYAALNFHWKTLGRCVRVEGPVDSVSEAEADAYFASRPRDSRIGAWASQQSRPLATREELEARIAEFDAKHPGDSVPRPPHWSGWRLAPERIEFWADRPFRLHDRLVFMRDSAASPWRTERLYP